MCETATLEFAEQILFYKRCSLTFFFHRRNKKIPLDELYFIDATMVIKSFRASYTVDINVAQGR